MEYIRKIEINVSIDTNKDTYKATFDNMTEANDFYDKTMEDIHP